MPHEQDDPFVARCVQLRQAQYHATVDFIDWLHDSFDEDTVDAIWQHFKRCEDCQHALFEALMEELAERNDLLITVDRRLFPPYHDRGVALPGEGPIRHVTRAERQSLGME